jgi:N-acetylmuramoyl-L-alanine amidase
MSAYRNPLVALLAALLVIAALPAEIEAEEPVVVRIDADLAGASMRLILNHSAPIVYAIRTSAGRIDVVYSDPVVIDPPEQRLDDPILNRYELHGDRSLTFYTGPGYRNYESFELRNPFRLVLDLQGTRGSSKTTGVIPGKKKKRGGVPQTVIVIDPGHGGAEHGAVGPTGLMEKNVTLELATRLRQLLQQERSINVVLTRDEDRQLGLDERTAIANHNQADLFLSIHLNASRRSGARGAETYYLSTDATDDEARTLAALENRSYDVGDGSSISKSDGNDSDLKLVLWDLAQNQFLAESSLLAERMQTQFNLLTGTRDRGVRQAPFRVLMGATMPAVLIEVGFISNADEEERFRNLGYRNQTAKAMANAVREYLRDLDRLSAPPGKGQP